MSGFKILSRRRVIVNTPHKPFNDTDFPVVVEGAFKPEYAIPEQFSVFLTQAYGFFDKSESNNRPPEALLQMSRLTKARQ